MVLKKIAKESVAFALNLTTHPVALHGSILMYHSVGDNNKFSTVPVAIFAAQLTFLKGNACKVIPLREMILRVKNKESTAGMVALTFDDGYVDFYENVFPLLKEHNYHATVFVVSGLIGMKMQTAQGQVFDIVNKKQIVEMVESGLVDVMPHTHSHQKLDELSHEAAVEEIEHSRNEIEAITRRDTDILAYPYGRYTSALVAYLSTTGTWLGAVSVEPGLVGEKSNVLLLPRNSVDSETGMSQFRMKVSDSIKKYIGLKHAKRQ